jgi:hypothetical protein
MDLNATLPWLAGFVVVLGIYLYVRSQRVGKKR